MKTLVFFTIGLLSLAGCYTEPNTSSEVKNYGEQAEELEAQLPEESWLGYVILAPAMDHTTGKRLRGDAKKIAVELTFVAGELSVLKTNNHNSTSNTSSASCPVEYQQGDDGIEAVAITTAKPHVALGTGRTRQQVKLRNTLIGLRRGDLVTTYTFWFEEGDLKAMIYEYSSPISDDALTVANQNHQFNRITDPDEMARFRQENSFSSSVSQSCAESDGS